MSRRAPTPGERRRDADRSRRRLLAAALDEFAAHGYAGARVHDIAERAGLNNQLVTYYFGGKAGIYRELQQMWASRDQALAAPELPLDEAVARYLDDVLDDPRMMRLMLWRGLAEPDEQPAESVPDQDDVAGLRRRQENGELHPDLDPATVLLVLIAAVAAPVALPQLAQRLFDADPGSTEFRARYDEQIRRLIQQLARR